MPLDSNEAERQLSKKFGFEKATGRSKDHHWYTLKLDGLPAITTKFSHGQRGSLSASIQAKIARQLRVPNEFFVGMIACTNSKTAYETRVRETPVPPWDVLLRG